MAVPVVTGLEVQVTGSKSLRPKWLVDSTPTSFFLVYRSSTNSFGSASLVATVANDVDHYNDYGRVAATQYFYWVVRQLDSVDSASGPSATATTAAGQVLEDAIDQAKRDAIWQWANDALDSLYSVMWRYQPMPKAPKPLVILNVTSTNPVGLSDDVREDQELLSGARTGSVSVLVVTDPQPPQRGLVTVKTLAAGQYLIQLNGVDYSATFNTTPTVDQVLQGLLAAIDKTKIMAWIYGTPGAAVEGLAVRSFDPDKTLTMNNTANLDIAQSTPPDADTLANRLASSLGDQSLRDALNAANIGVGTVGGVNDLSGMLETRYELRAQFDFKINLASNRPITIPIIDTVASLSGTFT